MVKVKYGEPYRTSFGKAKEKIKADTLGILLDQIEKKYQEKEHVNSIRKYSFLFLNNESLNRDDLEYKLKPKDEISIILMVSGG